MMARIPGAEDFGNVVAEPARYGDVQSSRGAVGRAIAAGVMGLATELRNQDEQAKREREIADRAQAAYGIQSGRVELQQLAETLAEDVRLGKVSKDDAETEWRARSGTAVTSRVSGAPATFGKAIGDALELDSAALTSHIRKAVSARNQADTRGSLLGGLEVLEREALSDRTAAVGNAHRMLTTLGPTAGFGEDDQVRMLSAFRERAAFNSGAALVRSARDDSAALDAALDRLKSDDFRDLSPEKFGQLEQQVLGRKAYLANQAAAQAARAEANAARRDREAETAFKAVQGLIDSGAIPAPEFLAQVSGRTAGTPYADALTGLLRGASERAGFAQQSPQAQHATILALRARANAEGSTPEIEKRISTFEKLRSDGLEQLKADPLAWGVNRRLIDALEPLDFGNVTDLVPQLERRVAQARAVAGRAGVPVSPLLADEAEKVGRVLQLLPIDERARAVRQLAQSVDSQTGQALAAQIAGKDKALGLAMFASVNAGAASRNVSALILRGADAQKAGRVPKDDAVGNADQTRIARELAAVPWATTQARDAAVEAAQLVYVGLRDERGGSASAREAITLATGGLTEWNATKVPLPPGMDERRFRRTLQTLDPVRVARQAGGDQVSVGGQALSVEQLVRNIGAVRLVPAGPGVYALESNGTIVMTAAGRPLRLDVRSLGD